MVRERRDKIEGDEIPSIMSHVQNSRRQLADADRNELRRSDGRLLHVEAATSILEILSLCTRGKLQPVIQYSKNERAYFMFV